VQRVGYLLKVKQDRIAEYKAYHKAVWPAIVLATRFIRT
jgi:L-rhamnose mutarotase